MLDPKQTLSFCQEKGFRLSGKAFLLLQDHLSREDEKLLTAVADLAKPKQDGKVVTESDMRQFLSQRTLQSTSMETSADANDEERRGYEEEIDRLKRIIQIIVNKHGR